MKLGCPKLPQTYCNQSCAGNSSETCGNGWTLEVLGKIHCRRVQTAPPASVGLRISVARSQTYSFYTNKPKFAGYALLSDAAYNLQPALPALEAKRDALQRPLAVGWAPSLHHNMLAMVKHPGALCLTYVLLSLLSPCSPPCSSPC